jgi:hypothetical protein
MAIKPIVRYMLLCDDWRLEQGTPRRVSIIGLISNIRAVNDSPYPLLLNEMCVFLALTEGRGQGQGKIVCFFEETGQKIFETRERSIDFGPDPLDVLGAPFRIRDCNFPYPGIFSIQFWYDGEKAEERTLRMR